MEYALPVQELALKSGSQSDVFLAGSGVYLRREEGEGMRLYWFIAVGLNYIVSVLLMMTAGQLSEEDARWSRFLIAAGLEAAYVGLSIRPEFSALRSLHWRSGVLFLVAAAAFGRPAVNPKSWALYILLVFAVNGMASSLGRASCLQLAAAGLVLWIPICFLSGSRRYVMVTIPCTNSCLHLRALRDTGNTLKDPVTGEQVLIVGGEDAGLISGLSINELEDPLQTICSKKGSGLHLIPFRSVGNPNGMMLAKRISGVRIGRKKESRMVAFSPQSIGGEEFQALAGGM